MIQDLADKVWANPSFHAAARSIELAWLTKELRVDQIEPVSERTAVSAMEAAAILACAKQLERRKLAHRVATSIFELFAGSNAPFDAALRVVLARLGNFPSIETKDAVQESLSALPWSLAAEEIRSAQARTIRIGDRSLRLTNFQFKLWRDLVRDHSIALSAPTSAGKSFIVQTYIASRLGNKNCSVVYLVPTRALITQVSNALAHQCIKQGGPLPDIVTVPLRPEASIPRNAVYVMTQERLHLTLSAHPELYADLVVVDEAHSIGDGARGILLHTIVEELLVRNSAAQVVFASPTLRNPKLFSRAFAISDIKEAISREPTVSQNFIVVASHPEKKNHISVSALSRSRSLNKLCDLPLDLSLNSKVRRLAHISKLLSGGNPTLVYANGPDEAEKISLHLTEILADRVPTPEQAALSSLIKDSVHEKFVLASCVLKGVGFHYSNIPTIVRQEIESAFSRGILDYLVCTSTLLQGVNLPAKNIFMLNPTKGNNIPLESPDFWNLSGRAGRLRQEFQGNVFLLDYGLWRRKPLSGPQDIQVASAIETAIKTRGADLISTIEADDRKLVRKKQIDLDAAFVRLFADLKEGTLSRTFQRAGVQGSSARAIKAALDRASKHIVVPASILRRTPNVSAHKQQQLYFRIEELVKSKPEAVSSLVPQHPHEPRSYESYASILELCHDVILGYDVSRNLHRFHALIAWRWMRGWPLPRIISDQIRRHPRNDPRKVIRDTLELIETEVRFQMVRLFSCYNALLEFALSKTGVVAEIPEVALYLEVGASNRTMVSFIALGLSRTAAIRLNGWCSDAEQEMNMSEAISWLRARAGSLETLELPELLVAEIRGILDKNPT